MNNSTIEENFFNFSNENFLMMTSKSKCTSNINIILKKNNFNINKLCLIKQVHSNKILFVENPGNFGNADGLITRVEYGNILSIVTADCIPMFIYDDSLGLFGLIHAGWRGIYKNIHLAAIEKFREFGSNHENISVFFGPCIKECCYEVKQDILDKFSSKYFIQKNNKFYLNLLNILIDDLKKNGIINYNISYCKICTFDNKNCESYRRDKDKNKRMISLMSYRS